METPSYHTPLQGSSIIGKSTTSHLDPSPPTYGDRAPRYVAKNPNPSSASDVVYDDKLPPYAPTLQLLTLCRRKHVMKSTGRKARSRRWKVVWLLLDGTALRIYVPTRDEQNQFEKEWNVKYCAKGKQDKKLAICNVATDDTDEEPEFDEPTETHDDSNILPSTSRIPISNSLQNRGRSSSMQKTRLASPLIRRSTLPPINAIIANVTLGPGTVLNIPVHPSLPSILSRKAHKSYPIRNATCTRPSSYFKRNFVIEFTLDGGKQFLVQLNSYEEVLTWQQVIPIATPLALDLDERPMPEPAAYPRPRRTRPRTAPANIDSTRIPNVPPSYPTGNPDSANQDVSDVRRPERRSLDMTL